MPREYIVVSFLCVCVCVCELNSFSVKDFSGTTLPRNMVQIMSMTSCIVRKEKRAVGSGPLELFPFVIFANEICIFLHNCFATFV